jgi:hypothetical protein
MYKYFILRSMYRCSIPKNMYKYSILKNMYIYSIPKSMYKYSYTSKLNPDRRITVSYYHGNVDIILLIN